jgi:hypothetical protein
MSEAPQNQSVGLTAEQAQAAMQFLQRTQLQGAEAPVLLNLVSALAAIVNGSEPKSEGE